MSAETRCNWPLLLALISPVLLPGTHGLFAGEAFSVALLPWTAPLLFRTPVLAWLLGSAVLGGLVLVGHAVAAGGGPSELFASAGLLITAPALIAAVLKLSPKADERRLLAALLVGMVVFSFLQPVPFFSDAPWKYALGVPVSFLLILATGRTSRTLAKLATASLAVTSVALGYRALAGALALALVLMPISERWQRRAPSKRLKLLPVASVGVLAGFGVNYAILAAATHGFLPQALTRKIEAQNTGALGVLLAARQESPFELAAISKHPVLGLGRSPTMGVDIATQGVVTLGRLGYTLAPDAQYYLLGSGLLPLHSTLLDLTAEAGIMGGLFGVLLAVALMTGFRVAAVHGGRVDLLYVALAVWFGWNLIFSPYSGMSRLLMEATVGVLLARRVAVSGN